VSVTYQ
jgi:hypothetical protein